ncbi:hypothetical protein [Xylophilus sp. GOD-11R]|uniref:hypothetical protein n=1 Tax=Xylophilus sp. GOD-11R TaxID=3089814 RepID=UPI00298CD86D|nr:hypothetical protein [Xylophilus sp. GOD-11R]WPB57670.1 hypothetical protein R9X41_03175 [Xylophilus sp. GOD-11R]
MTGAIHAGDFSDRRVILVRGHDTRCARFWDESSAGYEQACDGPTYLFLGCRAPDEKLQRLSERYGIPVAELVAFRNGELKQDPA